MENYKIIDRIGDGTYGVVYKCVETISGQAVAIKKLKCKFQTSNQGLNEREVRLLSKLKHENIIKLRQAFQEHDTLFLVFDHMDCSLLELMNRTQESERGFSEAEIKCWCFQIFRGLAHMHSRGCFHRDLKPDNLLIDEKQNVVKIADFGLASEIYSTLTYTKYMTTRWYRAPEVILTWGIYCTKVDMWAMGAIMAEMFNFAALFPGKNEFDQLFKICEVIGNLTKDTWSDGVGYAKDLNYVFLEVNDVVASLSEKIPSASEEAVSLIGSLLSWDPRKRPTALEALRHPFFSSCNTVSVPPQLSLAIQPHESEKKKIDSTVNPLRVDWGIIEKSLTELQFDIAVDHRFNSKEQRFNSGL